ncbi:sodium channel protein type 8 subunit alpha-like [Patella vulgata]|uniref:sodium channel protein type 8 subunit alpha-like n=1 Tax=Patella vulgata TaxID=6465 RepID=UPI00217F320C|nr:sodium channel protein type 8 subunit alpha-like [Patella vulgata]
MDLDEEVDYCPFRRFTRESLFNIERRIAEEKAVKQTEKAPAETDSSDDEGDEPSHHEPELKPNPKLEAGRKLPPSLEDFPAHLTGRPVEDLDEYYHNQLTFVVVGKDKTLYRFSATDAMFVLSPFNILRRCALYVLVHPYPFYI